MELRFKMANKIYFSILLACLIVECITEDGPVVTTKLGKIRGELVKSFEGRTFSQFEGIPYAKPPIGKLRFAEPVPIEPWTGIWQATTKYVCLQKHMIGPDIAGEEDCLYVNVYVPREKPNPKDNLDVIIHIHGGGFVAGSSHEYCHPGYIMDRDVIFVTFNYRVGILGFLTTADDAIPANLGLKDQALAMKWVKENIASFGGNPDSITLTGLSAGGGSVHLHYFSPLSKGLFHRGFAQSGTALNSWAIHEEPLLKARKLAVALGCPDNDNKALVECLRSRPGKSIIEKFSVFFDAFGNPLCPVGPVVEKGVKNAFLPEHPYKLLKDKRVYDVPLIASTTNDEGLFLTGIMRRNLEQINSFWTQAAPNMLDFNNTLDPSQWTVAANKIKDFYIGEGKDISEETFDELTKMFSDRFFISDAETAVRLQSEANKSPVYYMNFNYDGSSSITELLGVGKMKGVSHGDDALYYFGSNFIKKTPTEMDLKMRDKMLDILVKYSQTGVPEYIGGKWTPTKNDQLTYLDIVSPTEMTLKTVKELTYRKLWEELGLKENANLFKIKDEL